MDGWMDAVHGHDATNLSISTWHAKLFNEIWRELSGVENGGQDQYVYDAVSIT